MLETYLVYIFLLLFGFVSTYLIDKTSNTHLTKDVCTYFVFLIMSVIIGGRYEVGSDWYNYKELFESIYTISFFDFDILQSNIEPLYLLLNFVLDKFGVSTSWFFTILAFLQFVLLYKSTANYKIFPFVILFYICLRLGSSMNIIRQCLATYVFFVAIKYIGVNTVKYICCVVIAFLLHYSSIVLFPLFLICKKAFSFLDNKYIVIALYIMSMSITYAIKDLLITIVPMFTSYGKYVNNLGNLDETMLVSSGLGIIARHIINIILILKSTEFVRNNDMIKWYRCFVVGIILSNIFGISIFLSRIPFALDSLRIVLLAYLVKTLWSKKRTSEEYILPFFIIGWALMSFFFSIYNSDSGISPYKFQWI